MFLPFITLACCLSHSKHAKGKANSTAPTLHVITRNILGDMDIKN